MNKIYPSKNYFTSTRWFYAVQKNEQRRQNNLESTFHV